MKFILIPVLALLIFRCSSTSKMSPETQQTSFGRTTLTTAMEPVVISEYRLGFGDVLEIKFFNNEKFNETVTVRPDGRISLEIVGDIFVADKTPSQLDSIITATYAEIIKNPEVTVIVRAFSGYQVYVLGEVNKPGGFPLQRNMTLLHALASAGGVKEGGQMKSVMLLRRVYGNQVNAFKFDLTKHFGRPSGKITERDIYVQPLDIIYVPKTFISSASTFLKMVWDGLLPPVDVALRALYWREWAR